MKTALSVRPATALDAEFICKLASSVEGYTVPTPYVLWMLTRFHKDWSAVAEEGRKQLGYMLAFPASDATVFVWQFACTFRGQRLHAPDALASHLKRMTAEGGFRQIIFTTVPQSAAERAVRSIVRRVFKASIQKITGLPEQVPGEEWEYVLEP